MKAMKLLVVSLALSASPALAIGALNCSNADGTLARTEHEIWGANPVVWTVNDETVTPDNVEWIQGTYRLLEEGVLSTGIEERYKKFAMKVRLDYSGPGFLNGATVEDWVICNEWSSPAID